MYESVPQRPLPVLAKPSHDERARQLFAKDFRKYIMLDVPPLTRRVYEQEVKPAAIAARGAAPTTHTEVRDVMWEHGYLRAAQGLQRISQELMWGSIVPSVERQAAEILTGEFGVCQDVRTGRGIGVSVSGKKQERRIRFAVNDDIMTSKMKDVGTADRS